ncbi:hypothetical protein Enr10x_03110 [Gimesia panareensis]|uniref:Uncharacterized protein n=1 Tax=Gimesia panareensis TaxID=2527978 RepID=A0A517Q087_9PLAN|nr:hypothetical protein Enr10x_03110 [Gimesia panareensis]QDU48011.1 hypothetical protein Pan110_03230 [Gimesia panareensis]
MAGLSRFFVRVSILSCLCLQNQSNRKQVWLFSLNSKPADLLQGLSEAEGSWNELAFLRSVQV